MSLIIGGGMCLSYFESEITCPICEQKFNGSEKMDSAKNPVFNTKCPKCKGKITIKIPLMGGFTECRETNCPPTVKRLATVTPNHVNGIAYTKEVESKIDSSKYDEDDEEPDDGDADSPIIIKPPKNKK
jgi:hypothetical protein